LFHCYYSSISAWIEREVMCLVTCIIGSGKERVI